MTKYVVVFTHRNGTSWDGKCPAHVLDIVPDGPSNWELGLKYEKLFNIPNIKYFISTTSPVEFKKHYKNTGRRFE